MVCILSFLFLFATIFTNSIISSIDPSCFGYETKINITNLSPFTLSSHDILLVINTSHMILQNRLHDNCDDMMFRNGNNHSQWISYWIESGCRMEKTYVWITVERIEGNGTVMMIDVLSGYGCEEEMDREMVEGWRNGSFMVMSKSGCGIYEGYERYGEMDGYFMKGGVFGEKNESAGGGHKHEIIASAGDSSSSSTILGGAGMFGAKRYHSHDILAETESSGSDFPPYRKMMYCYNDKIDIYNNMVIMFNDNSLPDGFTPYNDLDNRFPLGDVNYGGTGGSNSHSHTVYSISGMSPGFDYDDLLFGSSSVSDPFHVHVMTGSTNSAGSNIPLYKNVVFGQANERIETITENMLFATNSLPPKGFQIFSDFDGYYIRGGTTYGGTGGSVDLTHHHTATCNFQQTELEAFGMGFFFGSRPSSTSHSHPSLVTPTEDVDFVVPFFSVMIVKQKSQPNVDIVYYTEEIVYPHKCKGKFPNNPLVCNTHGNCTGSNLCSCESGYTGNDCEYFECYGKSGYDNEHSLACNYPKGQCTQPNNCTCNIGFGGDECNEWSCFGYDKLNKSSCNGHGSCLSFDNCNCTADYQGTNCSDWKCFQIVHYEDSVCSGHGKCTNVDNCNCDTNYGSKLDCSEWFCNSVSNLDTDVCSNNGECIIHEQCNCSSGFYTSTCNLWDCFDIPKDSSLVCTRHGNCISHDRCICDGGGGSYSGLRCEYPICYGKFELYGVVCSGNGDCVSEDICECEKGYHGDECDKFFVCYGIKSNNSDVCSNAGNCIGKDACICQKNYKGVMCEFAPKSKYTAGIVGAAVGLSVFCFLVIFVLVGCIVFDGFFLKKYQKDKLEDKFYTASLVLDRTLRLIAPRDEKFDEDGLLIMEEGDKKDEELPSVFDINVV